MSPSATDYGLLDARPWVTNSGGWTVLSPIGVAVHHTVTLFLSPAATESDELNQVSAIDDYHVAMGYGGFGYHCIAFPSGRAYWCGHLDGARAHVLHRNHELRGVALAGTFTDSLPGPVQLGAAARAVAFCRADAPGIPVRGHREWAPPDGPTACPGDLYQQWVPGLAEEDDMTPEEVRGTVNAMLRDAIAAGNGLDHDSLIRADGDDEWYLIEVLADALP